MSYNEIIAICQQLEKEGKEPSVALIKSRMTKKAPMPVLITGLQQWRANPKAKVSFEKEELSKSSNEKSLQDRVTDLEAIVQELQQEIAALKRRDIQTGNE